MDESIKAYANTLYAARQMDSSNALREARLHAQYEIDTRRDSNVPLSGVDTQVVVRLFDAHIERCLEARFLSYKEAYSEVGISPSEQDFNDIISECKAVHTLEMARATTAIKTFIAARGPMGVPMNVESQVERGSAHGYDRLLREWSIWKAKTQLKSATAKVEEREKPRDVLLPVYNKAEFLVDLPFQASHSSRHSPLALVFMDLDNFSSINDEAGHETGDRALEGFARVVLEVSSGKGLAYRYGGDELCVLLPNHDIEEAFAVGQRICRGARAIVVEGLSTGLSTSVGVACVPGSTDDPGELLKLADAAMYVSKKAGGNQVSRAERLNN